MGNEEGKSVKFLSTTRLYPNGKSDQLEFLTD